MVEIGSSYRESVEIRRKLNDVIDELRPFTTQLGQKRS